MLISGRAKPWVCLVCAEQLQSGLVLERHMHCMHPLSRPHSCCQCESSFNNLQELSSHVANQHRIHKVSCKHCEYKTVSCARMRLHVRGHTHGLKCSRCDRKFPSVHSCWAHEKLHRENRGTFDCSECDNMYVTQTALRIHTTGKHGHGFVCDRCRKQFDTPTQRKQHQISCTHS